jgi:hypothetical protein
VLCDASRRRRVEEQRRRDARRRYALDCLAIGEMPVWRVKQSSHVLVVDSVSGRAA